MVMGIENQLDTPLAEAVRIKKGQSPFARMIKRSQSTVFDWLKKDQPLPAEHVLLVERETGVPRWRLRPDVYEREHATTLPVGPTPVAFEPTTIPNGAEA